MLVGYKRKSDHPLYHTWNGMMQRCQNVESGNYWRYGGRGIKICNRWQSFENFAEDMGERPEGMTLDRINNGLDYMPSNCRWATRTQQNNNRDINQNNTSGIKGVSFDKVHNKWIAHITINYKYLNLGRFRCLEDAVAIRKQAEIRYNV